MDYLSTESLINIYIFLSIEDILRLSSSCKYFYEVWVKNRTYIILSLIKFEKYQIYIPKKHTFDYDRIYHSWMLKSGPDSKFSIVKINWDSIADDNDKTRYSEIPVIYGAITYNEDTSLIRPNIRKESSVKIIYRIKSDWAIYVEFNRKNKISLFGITGLNLEYKVFWGKEVIILNKLYMKDTDPSKLFTKFYNNVFRQICIKLGFRPLDLPEVKGKGEVLPYFEHLEMYIGPTK